ncbi:IclR family transcriptional regulator [Amycolatopsis nigrescens]|uniref:IclR family transcriptional regulator n=1 Tax=Amycolatopsis nigrescens TaxID=381445 RepID=UPI0003749EF2|nr:IclR family transcriptional regulator C-terminal domain-containing protein [Amycolatopsis nigrescens]
MSESSAKAHRTVSRVTTILEGVARQGGARMHELAAILEAPKSSVFGLVKGLVATGYLIEDKGTYRLGPALGSLLTSAGPDIAAAARPSLEWLRDTFNETVMLGTAVGESLTYIDAVESTQPIRYSAPLRIRRPLYPPSAGKVLLSHWSEARRDAYLRSVLESEDRVRAARTELDAVRAEGVALNRGETLPDVSAAARPVLVGDEVVAAIAVAGPTSRIADRLPEIAEVIATATEAVARRLSSPAARR